MVDYGRPHDWKMLHSGKLTCNDTIGGNDCQSQTYKLTMLFCQTTNHAKDRNVAKAKIMSKYKLHLSTNDAKA